MSIKVSFKNTIRLTGLIVALYLAVLNRTKINDSVIVIIVLLLFSFVTGFFDYKKEIKLDLISLLLSLLLTLQISLSEFYNAVFINDSSLLIRVILVTVILANAYIIVNFILDKINKANEWPSTDLDKRKILLCKCAIVIETLLYLISSYEGIWLSGDVANVYGSVLSNSWSAWNTIGYSLFVKLCALIYESHFTVNVLQSFLWIVINFYIIDLFSKQKSKCVYLYTILMCLASSPFLYLEEMIKDTVFSIGVLALTALIYKIIKIGPFSKGEMVLFLFYPLFPLLCRHGGIMPVIGTLLILLLYFRKKKNIKATRQILIGITWFLSVYLFVNVGLTQILNIEKNPTYVKYSTPLSMIGAAVSQGVEFADSDIEILERIMPIEDWANCYNRYWADDISRTWGKIGHEAIERLSYEIDNNSYGIELLKLNFKLLVNHPYIYLKAFFDMNSIVWEIARPEGATTYFVAMVPESDSVRYSAAYQLTSVWTQFLDNFSLTRATFTRGGVSTFIIVFCAFLMLKLKNGTLFCILPIVIINLMLLITIPAQDTRYVLPSIECAILLISIVYCELQKK